MMKGIKCTRSWTVVMAHHNTLESDVVRSGAISYGIVASIEDPVCLFGTGTFRPGLTFCCRDQRAMLY